MNNNELGVMGSNPVTGECIAAFAGDVTQDEMVDMMGQGLVIQRKPLGYVKESFCEVHPSRRVTLFGESIGRYMDRDIPAWYETADGQRHEYVRVCGQQIDLNALSEGQSVLAPG